MSWQPLAYQALLNNNYSSIANTYEQLIEEEPETMSHYWYLGLAYLLQQQAEEAQSIWIYGMTQLSPDAMEGEMLQLAEILETEAQRQETLENYELASLIWYSFQEVNPESINSLLHLVNLEIILNRFTPNLLTELQIIELLQNAEKKSVNTDLLLQVLGKVLEFPSVEAVALAEASLSQITNLESFISTVIPIAIRMAHDEHKPTYSADLTQLCLKNKPNNLYLLNHLLGFYDLSKDHDKSLEIAKIIYKNHEKLCPTPTLKLYYIYRVLVTFLKSGAWLEIEEIVKKYKKLLLTVANQPKTVIEPHLRGQFLGVVFPLFYLFDNPKENRYIINHISGIVAKNLTTKIPKIAKNKISNHKLKVGYLASTLRNHSVGWLSRWLFQYHDYNQFEIGLYLINQPEDELTRKSFKEKVHYTYNFSREPEIIAQQIQENEVDILIDLDSLTNNIACQVLALKPSKIQATWLGFDAVGLSAIDYFIADSYVLPDNSQDYYQEKIWRLPQTYVAVDGFEVGEQTLTRESLNIPEDGIIYLSVQNGFKRHPDTIDCQMQILKQVPNSYFLIKGLGNDEKIQNLFKKIALDSDVDVTKLRFLPRDDDELTHRANLQIADIVLDTYPYNGATTSLEVLWMGIPLVTRVGEQFAARNSYAFMTNLGLNEGIAWTNHEYIEWGIKLGKDESLRQQIHQKLIDSRRTSPLWNAQEFTKQMENGYQQMWEIYINK